MNPIVRKMVASVSLDDYAEKLTEDDAFPIIMIGKVEDEDRLHVYSLQEVDRELILITLLRVTVELAGGLDKLLQFVESQRQNHD